MFVERLLLVSLVSSTATSLTISWSLAEGLTAGTFTISHSNTNTDCFNTTGDGSGSGSDIGMMTMYTLTGLEDGTEYSITVTATLTGGGAAQHTITAFTMTAGLSR